jgi:hypothetical protein
VTKILYLSAPLFLLQWSEKLVLWKSSQQLLTFRMFRNVNCFLTFKLSPVRKKFHNLSLWLEIWSTRKNCVPKLAWMPGTLIIANLHMFQTMGLKQIIHVIMRRKLIAGLLSYKNNCLNIIKKPLAVLCKICLGNMRNE